MEGHYELNGLLRNYVFSGRKYWKMRFINNWFGNAFAVRTHRHSQLILLNAHDACVNHVINLLLTLNVDIHEKKPYDFNIHTA